MKSTGKCTSLVLVIGVLAVVLGTSLAGCSSDDDPVLSVWNEEYGCYQCITADCDRPNEDYLQCIYPFNKEQNVGKQAIAMGGSNVMGVGCYHETAEGPQCGFVPALEARTGMEIANFGFPYLSAGMASTIWTRVDRSARLNPDATRVYLMTGGNDLIQAFLLHRGEAPLPETGCELSDWVVGMIDKTLDDVRRIVERYKKRHKIPQIVVASTAPIGEDSLGCNSCASQIRPICGDCVYCINQLLGYWSERLNALLDSMGGAEAGIYFADMYSGFSPGPRGLRTFLRLPPRQLPGCRTHGSNLGRRRAVNQGGV